MTPHDVILEARKRGLRIAAAGDKLAIMPKGACPPDFADTLRQHKADLLTWLTSPPCPGWQAMPPDNLHLATICPRPTPYDRERVIAYLRRQTGDRPGPLCAWLVQRETAYFDGPGARWPCCLLAYAAARDAACWQLNRPEREVWGTLAGFDEAAKSK